MEQNEFIRRSIIRDMSEGVLVLALDGCIQYLNPAAERILDRGAETLLGKKIVAAFYEYSENDTFNQAILDAVYDPASTHYQLAPYFTGSETRHLHIMTSYLRNDETPVGIVVVLGDITELVELKNRYTQQITDLLDSLVKALSTAIDERSPYTANHTRNMVKLGEAFMDWLDETHNPFHFDDDKRRAFLMSLWLHDVGKLSVPLSVMDKSTRLSDSLERIEMRFKKVHFLSRIALLEKRLTPEAYAHREKKMETWLAQIRRINTAGYLTDEDMTVIQEIAAAHYADENGKEQPVLTESEITDLLIRKGTLTDEERSIMQNHASSTGRILRQVSFPDAFAMVPDWAAAHHELLDGTGYPLHKRGDEIPKEVRLLTILDIFEALTAKDRPYKSPLPVERSLNILENMVQEGSIDGEILDLFIQSRAWETIL